MAAWHTGGIDDCACPQLSSREIVGIYASHKAYGYPSENYRDLAMWWGDNIPPGVVLVGR
jgi:hypothetical protein